MEHLLLTYDKLLHILDSWGMSLKTEHYYDFKNYMHQMMKRHRMIIVTDSGNVIAIIFFFLTFNYQNLYKKSEWATPEDNSLGNQIYIDKMICKKWTLAIRRKVQELIQTNYPEVTLAYYHRAPNDRCVKINRRAMLCIK